MARESSDPEQQSMFGSLSEDNDTPPEERLEPKTVVIGGESVRKGDKKVEPERGGEGGLDSPMRASPEPPREDPGVTELKRQLNNQQQITARVAQVAQDEHQARVYAERGLATSNLSMVDQAIEAGQRASEQARVAFQAALDRGDHKRASEAQIAIADSRANLLRLMEMREGLAQPEPQRQQPQPQPRQAPSPQYLDPTQQMQANVQNLSSHLDRTGFPKSAAWIRANPERVKDRDAINKVDGVHSYLTNTLGLIPETPDYFDRLDEELDRAESGERGKEIVREGTRLRQMEAGVKPQPRSYAAPSRSEAPSYRTGHTRGVGVHLTALQREHAHNVLGMTDEEYAESLLDARDRGKLLGARA